MTPEERTDDPIVFDFVHRYLEDLEAGDVRPLTEYLARFPGHEEAIAREFTDLREDSRRSPEPGSAARFGPYRVERELGRGGQGTVFLAEDVRLSRHVALKVLSSALGEVPAKRRARLRREAEVIARLDHPGLCDVYEAELDGESPWIAMRYVAGEPLSKTIARAKRRQEQAGEDGERPAEVPRPGTTVLPCGPHDAVALRELLAFFERAARALHAAHEAGVIHRDVKPGNLMVTPEGDCVILDFGMAREETGEQETLTHTGEIFGTPAYIAPEQLDEGEAAIDRRADVYSLGVALYEALTLRRPFESASGTSLREAIRHGVPGDPRRHNSVLTEDVKVVLETALEKDPSRRYATALDLAEDLRRVREYEPILARPAGPLLRLRRWTRRHPRIAAITAGSIVVLAVGLSIALVLLREKARLLRLYEGGYYRDLAANELAFSPARALDLALRAAEREPGYLSNQAIRGALDELGQEYSLPSRQKVVGFALSDDGELVATYDSLGWVRVWSVADGRLLADRLVDGERPSNVAFGPSGGCLVTTSNTVARIWDVSLGGDPIVLDRHTDWVQAARFNPAGDRIATVSEDGTAQLWDDTGQPLATLRGHEGVVTLVEFSPDGRHLVTGAGMPGRNEDWIDKPVGRTARIWDGRTGEPLKVLVGHEDALNDIAFARDGERFLTASMDGTVRIWSGRNGRGEAVLRVGNEVKAASFDATGSRVAIAWDPVDLADPGAGVWDVETGERLFDLVGHENRTVWDVAYSPDGDRIATLSSDLSLRLWHADDGIPLDVLRGRGDRPLSLYWTPTGDRILTSRWSRFVDVWYASPPPFRPTIEGHSEPLVVASFDRPGERLLTASEDGTACVWDLDDRALIARLEGHTDAIASAVFSTEGERILTASRDGTARIWDPSTGGTIHELAGHVAPLIEALFHPDGDWVITASEDGVTRVWDPETGGPIARLGDHEGGVTSVAISPKGRYVATGGMDRRVRIWSPPNQVPILESDAITTEAYDMPEVFALAFSPDEELLVAAFASGALHAWRCGTGEHVFGGYFAVVGELAFHPDGHELACGARWSGSVYWISTDDWKRSREIEFPHASTITALEYAPDGEWLLSTSLDGEARISHSDGRAWVAFPHTTGVFAADFHPNGTQVVTGALDGTARIFPTNVVEAGWSARPYPTGTALFPDSVTPSDY